MRARLISITFALEEASSNGVLQWVNDNQKTHHSGDPSMEISPFELLHDLLAFGMMMSENGVFS